MDLRELQTIRMKHYNVYGDIVNLNSLFWRETRLTPCFNVSWTSRPTTSLPSTAFRPTRVLFRLRTSLPLSLCSGVPLYISRVLLTKPKIKHPSPHDNFPKLVSLLSRSLYENLLIVSVKTHPTKSLPSLTESNFVHLHCDPFRPTHGHLVMEVLPSWNSTKSSRSKVLGSESLNWHSADRPRPGSLTGSIPVTLFDTCPLDPR